MQILQAKIWSAGRGSTRGCRNPRVLPARRGLARASQIPNETVDSVMQAPRHARQTSCRKNGSARFALSARGPGRAEAAI
jgi:hypothetical protein